MIAALYVAERGCYTGLDDVDPWTEARDARKYDGPHAVVAHPPCQRWGRYWFGGPSSPVRFRKGDDGGCFAAALASVRKWGGILEHPAGSYAWGHHAMMKPGPGGWFVTDDVGGWSCQVEQGHYGHRARKSTWLYAVRCDLPSLNRGPSVATAIIDEGHHTAEERQAGKAARSRGERSKNDMLERMGHRERLATPHAFRDLLLSIARTAKP